jgi:hypothetical protein
VNGFTKQRTREHVIADLSVNHAERQMLLAGYVADRVIFDYGYDLIVRTFDEDGHIERGCFSIQLKASDAPDYSADATFISHRLDPREQNMWREEILPVALVIYDANRNEAFWVHYQALAASGRLTVRVPTDQIFDLSAVQRLRQVKNNVRREVQNAGD